MGDGTDSGKMITRAMVPVLLCFDIEHEPGITEEQFNERAAELVIRNLGDIGEEADKVDLSPSFTDEMGRDLDAALYPSDFDWCDTLKEARPGWESSRAGEQQGRSAAPPGSSRAGEQVIRG